MRKLFISALAVVAFGATFVGAKTARAERWISSGWVYVPGHYTNVNIPGGFVTTVDINYGDASVNATVSMSNTGLMTNSAFTNQTGNCSGTGNHSCPTTHWAFALCSDNTFITGPMEFDRRTSVSQPATYSYTGLPPKAYGQGRWTSSWGQVGDTTGFCAELSGASYVAGGVWMYEYGPW